MSLRSHHLSHLIFLPSLRDRLQNLSKHETYTISVLSLSPFLLTSFRKKCMRSDWRMYVSGSIINNSIGIGTLLVWKEKKREMDKFLIEFSASTEVYRSRNYHMKASSLSPWFRDRNGTQPQVECAEKNDEYVTLLFLWRVSWTWVVIICYPLHDFEFFMYFFLKRNNLTEKVLFHAFSTVSLMIACLFPHFWTEKKSLDKNVKVATLSFLWKKNLMKSSLPLVLVHVYCLHTISSLVGSKFSANIQIPAVFSDILYLRKRKKRERRKKKVSLKDLIRLSFFVPPHLPSDRLQEFFSQLSRDY